MSKRNTHEAKRARKKAAARLRCRGLEWHCTDCGIPVHDEYYMVHDHLWASAGLKSLGGQACIGCLEKRLHRTLNAADFADVPVNDPEFLIGYCKRSKRFLNRLSRK